MMTRRDLQKRQTRQAFFQAVLDLSMSGHAFSTISLRQVTREVGVVPTAFYRHFTDMDDLGQALVNEALGQALNALREYLKVGQLRTHRGQIAGMVQLFFNSIDSSPLYWHFIVTERYGGNMAVQAALTEQIGLFGNILTEDLRLQPAFSHLPISVLQLIADMGVNVFFSWVQPWLSLDKEDTASKQALIDKSTKQAQILFYGVSHWRPKSEELGED
jgi:AcrR family transcriptional regulator